MTTPELRHEPSGPADTARGLLLTVLGEFVLPSGGRAWTQTLVGLLDLLDVNSKAARQAIARMHQRGWLDRRKIGRQTQWLLTDASRLLLEPGAQRIYSFGQTVRPWNGSWVVLLASMPERDRHLRYRMTTGLNWAGFGSFGQGVWLSPWVDQEHSAVDLMRGLGVDATTFRATLGELGSPPSLAAVAWDVVDLQRQYETFLDDTSSMLRQPPRDGHAAVTMLTTLVHHWRRFPFIDPDLPAELLPIDWPAPLAAARFADLRAALRGPALDWWQTTESTFSAPR